MQAADARDDALEILADDHEHLRRRFDAYEDLIDDDALGPHRLRLALEICDLLTAHADAEEEVFYPAVRLALGDDDPVDEAEAEHGAMRERITRLRTGDPDDDSFDADMAVLSEMVRRHVLEEEGELFPRLRDADEIDLLRVVEQFVAVRDEVFEDLQRQRQETTG